MSKEESLDFGELIEQKKQFAKITLGSRHFLHFIDD